MTKSTRFTLHFISIVLMIAVLNLGHWLSTDTMMLIFTAIGSITFGFGWKRATDYLIEQYETNTQNRL